MSISIKAVAELRLELSIFKCHFCQAVSYNSFFNKYKILLTIKDNKDRLCKLVGRFFFLSFREL